MTVKKSDEASESANELIMKVKVTKWWKWKQSDCESKNKVMRKVKAKEGVNKSVFSEKWWGKWKQSDYWNWKWKQSHDEGERKKQSECESESKN